MLRVLIVFFLLFLNKNIFAQEDYFLTLRYNEVNLRQGPSKKYLVKIFYKKKFLSVLIQDQSDNFRNTRDHENNTGWIHVSQLSKKKAAIVLKDEVMMFKEPTIYSTPIAILKKGKLVKISKCKNIWCKTKLGKYKGWVKKEGLWGRF